MAASFAWIEKVNVPPTVGVPVIAPVAVFKVSPLGNVPEDTLNVWVAPGLPPCTATVAEYALVRTLSGSAAVVMESGGTVTGGRAAVPPFGFAKAVWVFTAWGMVTGTK